MSWTPRSASSAAASPACRPHWTSPSAGGTWSCSKPTDRLGCLWTEWRLRGCRLPGRQPASRGQGGRGKSARTLSSSAGWANGSWLSASGAMTSLACREKAAPCAALCVGTHLCSRPSGPVWPSISASNRISGRATGFALHWRRTVIRRRPLLPRHVHGPSTQPGTWISRRGKRSGRADFRAFGLHRL